MRKRRDEEEANQTCLLARTIPEWFVLQPCLKPFTGKVLTNLDPWTLASELLAASDPASFLIVNVRVQSSCGRAHQVRN